jgi:UbiD family decarboxylase
MTIKIDRNNIPRTYRDYIEKLRDMGEMREIDDEVDWKYEQGAILRRTGEECLPGPIFNKIKDSPEGFRAACFGNAKSGTKGEPWRRTAVMLGLPPETPLMEMMHAYMEARETGKPHPPNIVDETSAPCKENKWFGDDIDLFKFPTPLGHAGDKDRVIQQAGINICQTPDGKWTNWSTNRGSIIDKNTMAGLWIPRSQHNGMIHQMWVEQGKDMPFAIAFGVNPVVATQAGSRVPDYVDEYDVASALLDAPLDMVKCETSDLLVPADSEIVIEGLVSASDKEMEGPFGEYPGYLFEGSHPQPRQPITAVTFRNNPILPLALPGVPTDTTHINMGFFGGADATVVFREAGLPVVDCLFSFESSLQWLLVRVSNDWYNKTGLGVDDFIQKIGDTLWNNDSPGRHMGHFATKVIVVTENVDISNNDQVTWAFASRSHPTYGTYLRPEWDSFGSGLEAYHSVNEHYEKKGGGAVIYSCLPIAERTGLKAPLIMSFEKNYPLPLQEKVNGNLKKWGFE